MNPVFINPALSFQTFFKANTYGAGLAHTNFYLHRFECFKKVKIRSLSAEGQQAFLRNVHLTLPRLGKVKDKRACHIIFLDLVQTYKGWRHFKGYPSNGQRTWSNANCSYKSNTTLRDHKARLAKAFYGRAHSLDLRVSLMAEHINALWKAQWLHEWRYSRNQLRRTIMRNPYNFKLDLAATALGLLGTLRKDNPKLGKKKKKILTGSVGFDQGFTRLYFKYQSSLSAKKRLRRKPR